MYRRPELQSPCVGSAMSRQKLHSITKMSEVFGKEKYRYIPIESQNLSSDISSALETVMTSKADFQRRSWFQLQNYA
jgi:hypothetical protein